MLRELSLPAIDDGVLAKCARLAREGRGEDLVPVLELIRMVGIGGDIAAEGGSVVRSSAREHAENMGVWYLLAHMIDVNTSTIAYVISKEMKRVNPVPDCSAAAYL